MELLRKGAFGKMRAFLYVYAIESQKRGLPHAHILLWVASEDKVKPKDIDLVISAENPRQGARSIAAQDGHGHMIHGPCGTLN